jgi:protein involved in temperature-dependent protein secretion
MADVTETLLRAAARLDEDASTRARREHDVRLMGTLAGAMRESAAEHVADADGRCAGCVDMPWPCPPALRWLAIANIALEDRPKPR